MVISGVSSPEETSARQGNQPQQHRSSVPRHDASISALLNDKQTQKLQYQPQQEQQRHHHHEDYLPTPVTPATSFPAFPTSSLSFSRPIEASVSPLPSTHAIKTMSPKSNSIASPEEQPISSIHFQQQQQQQRRISTEKTPSTRPVDKPYACTHCNQTFSRPHNLKSHLTTHSSERPFQCDICKNYFRRHHDLKRHRKLHTGERPYSCNVCHRSFARLDALNRHCRAEGGTACSSVHRVQGRRTIGSLTSPATTTTTTTTTTSHTSNNNINNGQRPIIPQLHIAHPATQPIANEVYPYPPTNNSMISHPITTSNDSTATSTTTLMPGNNNIQQHDPAASMTTPAASPQPLPTHSTSNITSSSSSSSSASSSSSCSAKRLHDSLLPSPSALSRLPVSESRDLVPIQKPHPENMDHEKATISNVCDSSMSHSPTSATPITPSIATTTTTTTTTPPPNPHRHSTPPPYYGWISSSPGRDDRTLPLPNRYPSNSNSDSNHGNNNTSSNGGEKGHDPSWERLWHENNELRREIVRWKSSAEELNTLKSQLHDLQVENKVLRSLITESSLPGEQHNQSKRKSLPCQIKAVETYKRRNLSNI